MITDITKNNDILYTGFHLGDFSWDEVRDYFRDKSQTLIIPTGTCEQHGYHLPLNNDILITEFLANVLSSKTNALIAPTINYGVNLPCDSTLSGTTTLSPKILRDIIVSITSWWRKQGIKLFILLTYHGDPFHLKALNNIHNDIALIEPSDIDYSNILEYQETIRHSCEAETSAALYLYPQKVRMNKVKEYDIPYPEFRPYLYHEKTDKPNGYVGALGYPLSATVEKGELIIRKTVEKMMADYMKIIESQE